MWSFFSPRSLFQIAPLLAACLAASALLFGIALHLEQSHAQTQFRELAQQRIIAITANTAITHDSVDLLVGHFTVAPPGSTSRAQFRQMVAGILADRSFIQGFSWDPRISAGQIAELERQARLDGLPDFKIFERDADGKARPVSSRADYVPIYYMEPQASNLRALGFDLASHPTRRQALERGRDLGQPQATGRITLVQEYGDQFGILVLAPVFGGVGPQDPDSNRRNLTGYISGVFRLGDLIDLSAATGAAAQALPLVDIHLFDLSAPENEQRLYPKSALQRPTDLTLGLHLAQDLDMAGRAWRIIAVPSAAFLDKRGSSASYVTLAVSLLASTLLIVYVRGRITQTERATAFARDMAEARLRLHEAQRIARLGCLEIDQADRHVRSDDGALDMLGGTLPDLPAILERVHPDDRNKLSQAFDHPLPDPAGIEFRITGQDGLDQVFHALLTAKHDHQTWLLTLQEITARKKAEEERATMIQRFAESDRLQSLGTLAGGIAHEINTPTQYVGDNVRFIQDNLTSLLDLALRLRAGLRDGTDLTHLESPIRDLDLDFLQEELPAAAQQALDGTARIGKIVQAIKEFSYPSARNPQPMDLNHTIGVVATITQNQWKNVAELTLDLDQDLPKIVAIEGEIAQVLVNLIVNAAQAMPDQSPDHQGRITLSTRSDQAIVEIQVRDNGRGIPAPVQRQIFEMFFTTKAPGQGTGQGLAITRSIIRRHGGDILVQSTPQAGSCFTVRLPLGGPAIPTPDDHA